MSKSLVVNVVGETAGIFFFFFYAQRVYEREREREGGEGGVRFQGLARRMMQ